MIFEARNSARRLIDGDVLAELGQEDRLLHRGVAAADHEDLVVLEERGVAGRAVGDAAAGELLLAGHAELLVLGAHGQDDGAGAVLLVADPDLVDAARLGGQLDLVASSVTRRAPKRSAWSRKRCIISGPMIPSGKPG